MDTWLTSLNHCRLIVVICLYIGGLYGVFFTSETLGQCHSKKYFDNTLLIKHLIQRALTRRRQVEVG